METPILEIKDIQGLISDRAIYTPLEDFGAVVSYTGNEVEELVAAIVKHKGNDPYHQGDSALKGVLQSMFNIDDFFVEVLLSKSIHPKEGGLAAIAKETNENLMEDADAKDAVLKYANYVQDPMGFNYDDKETQLKFFHIEVDAFIKIISESFAAIEAKMFTCPIDDEAKVLKKLLAKAELEYYIQRRDSFYFLMVFSFFYDDADEKSTLKVAHRTKRKLSCEDKATMRFPVKHEKLGIASPWQIHLCILDKNVFSPGNKAKIKPGKLAKLELNTIREHQLIYLKRVKQNISDEIEALEAKRTQSGEGFDAKDQFDLDFLHKLSINICFNYNILKVHHLSGLIGELKNRILLKESIIEEKDGIIVEKDGIIVKKEVAYLEEKAVRLKLEAEFRTRDSKIKKRLLKEAEDCLNEAKQIRSKYNFD